MNKHVQIREIPESLHRKLKARASEEGMSMSDYLKRLIASDLRRPRWKDVRAKMSALAPVSLSEPLRTTVRRERDAR